MPALFTTTSTGPHALVAASKAAATWAGSVTSAGTATAWPPSATIRAAASSSSARRRATRATRAPAAPKATAVARPMPLDAPVTSTERSRKASRQSIALPRPRPRSGCVGPEHLQVVRALERRRLGDVLLAHAAAHLADRRILALFHPAMEVVHARSPGAPRRGAGGPRPSSRRSPPPSSPSARRARRARRR